MQDETALAAAQGVDLQTDSLPSWESSAHDEADEDAFGDAADSAEWGDPDAAGQPEDPTGHLLDPGQPPLAEGDFPAGPDLGPAAGDDPGEQPAEAGAQPQAEEAGPSDPGADVHGDVKQPGLDGPPLTPPSSDSEHGSHQGGSAQAASES